MKDDQTIALLCPRSADQMRLARKHFERDPIQYALETDWLAGAAGLEPLHQESCPRAYRYRPTQRVETDRAGLKVGARTIWPLHKARQQ